MARHLCIWELCILANGILALIVRLGNSYRSPILEVYAVGGERVRTLGKTVLMLCEAQGVAQKLGIALS